MATAALEARLSRLAVDDNNLPKPASKTKVDRPIPPEPVLAES